mmetsp:Transcript_9306/g.27776  ORF Transcript_9306/g.27776 Transcript_9306/m.27776 type:complete len:240 (-) Transcript_9306:42-761(-)
MEFDQPVETFQLVAMHSTMIRQTRRLLVQPNHAPLRLGRLEQLRILLLLRHSVLLSPRSTALAASLLSSPALLVRSHRPRQKVRKDLRLGQQILQLVLHRGPIGIRVFVRGLQHLFALGRHEFLALLAGGLQLVPIVVGELVLVDGSGRCRRRFVRRRNGRRRRRHVHVAIGSVAIVVAVVVVVGDFVVALQIHSLQFHVRVVVVGSGGSCWFRFRRLEGFRCRFHAFVSYLCLSNGLD